MVGKASCNTKLEFLHGHSNYIDKISFNDSLLKIGPYGVELIWHIIVYQMGRLCGGAHEISGIKAPIFLRGWVGGVLGLVVVGWVGWGCRVGWVGMGVGVVGWVVVGRDWGGGRYG